MTGGRSSYRHSLILEKNYWILKPRSLPWPNLSKFPDFGIYLFIYLYLYIYRLYVLMQPAVVDLEFVNSSPLGDFCDLCFGKKKGFVTWLGLNEKWLVWFVSPHPRILQEIMADTTHNEVFDRLSQSFKQSSLGQSTPPGSQSLLSTTQSVVSQPAGKPDEKLQKYIGYGWWQFVSCVKSQKLLGEVKKKKCFASPPASFFEAAWIYFLFFIYKKREK